jgi:flagellar biosynthesis GTPase FlhF
VKLLNRLNWKLSNGKVQPNDDRISSLKNREKLEEKQLKAASNRRDRESLKQDFINEKNQRLNEVKEKLAEKKAKQQNQVSKKLEDAEERYEARMHSIKMKGKKRDYESKGNGFYHAVGKSK